MVFSNKKVQGTIIIVCIGLAIIVTYTNIGGGGRASIKPGDRIWLKCRNPDCGEAFQITRGEYFEYTQKILQEKGFVGMAYLCPKCQKKSAYPAIKCLNCGNVFEKGTVPYTDGPADTCPECGFSKMEGKVVIQP